MWLATDLKMPGLDGLGLLRKALEHEPTPAVVLMTAFGDKETAAAVMRAGATDYLTKPMNIDNLSRVVERALERRRLRKPRSSSGSGCPRGAAAPKPLHASAKVHSAAPSG